MIDWFFNIDMYVASFLYTLRNPYVVNFFIGVSELGDPNTILGLAGITAVILLYKRKWMYAIGLLVTILGSAAAATVLKAWFARPRIGIDIAAYLETSFSFPSGHATMSFAFYGFLLWFLQKEIKDDRKRMAATFGLIVLLGLIGYSRLYLGVHYLSDIVGGYLVATAFIILGVLTVRFLKKMSSRRFAS